MIAPPQPPRYGGGSAYGGTSSMTQRPRMPTMQVPYGPGHPPPSPAAAPAGATAQNPYSYAGDPILQQALGIGVKQGAQADAQKIEDQRKTLLGFGSADLARRLFGKDTNFVAAVSGNPFSSLANIAHKYEGAGGMVNQANESLNQQNLFFSSARLNQALPEIYRQRLGEETGAAGQAQDALAQIMRSNLGTHNDINAANLAAQQDAAQRAVQAALASGYGPGAATPRTGTSFAPRLPSTFYAGGNQR